LEGVWGEGEGGREREGGENLRKRGGNRREIAKEDAEIEPGGVRLECWRSWVVPAQGFQKLVGCLGELLSAATIRHFGVCSPADVDTLNTAAPGLTTMAAGLKYTLLLAEDWLVSSSLSTLFSSPALQ